MLEVRSGLASCNARFVLGLYFSGSYAAVNLDCIKAVGLTGLFALCVYSVLWDLGSCAYLLPLQAYW